VRYFLFSFHSLLCSLSYELCNKSRDRGSVVTTESNPGERSHVLEQHSNWSEHIGVTMTLYAFLGEVPSSNLDQITACYKSNSRRVYNTRTFISTRVYKKCITFCYNSARIQDSSVV
jgi:hypothetical protein